MAEHVLKTRPDYWDAVNAGVKTFEIRVNDRGYQAADTLVLIKGDDFRQCMDIECPRAGCTPKWLRRRVSYVFSGDCTLRDDGGIKPGHVVLGLAPSTDSEAVRDGIR